MGAAVLAGGSASSVIFGADTIGTQPAWRSAGPGETRPEPDLVTLGLAELRQRHRGAVIMIQAAGRDDLLVALRRVSTVLGDTDRTRVVVITADQIRDALEPHGTAGIAGFVGAI